MQRIKLNERQILMLKKLQEEESNKNKVLRITESQYNRLFNGKGKASKNLDKNLKKTGIGESNSVFKEINLVDFAQEIVVFIKDVLSNPRTMNFSQYWETLAINKAQLFKLVKNVGLLALADDNAEIKEYVAPKFGLRAKIKELHKDISEKCSNLNEFGDAGYPAGADNDPNATYNQDEPEQGGQEEIINISDSEKKFKILYMNPQDGLGIFKAGGELFVASNNDIGINQDPVTFAGKVYLYDYEGQVDNITSKGLSDYINDMYNQGEIKPVRNDKTDKFPVPTLISPTVKKRILGWYGDDPKVSEILGQLPETSMGGGAGGDSGQIGGVGGASFKGSINKDTGKSPEEAMGDLLLDEGKWGRIMKGVRSNPQGPFSIVAILNNKVVGQANDIKIPDAIPAYYEDMKRKYPNAKISIENGEGLSVYNEALEGSNNNINDGVEMTESQESDKLAMLINSAINQVDESLSFKDFAEAVAKILANNYGSHLYMKFLEVLTNSLPIDLGETSSTVSVGGDSGTFAYDAPAGDGKDFWTAGNKMNKGKADKPNGTPIVRGGSMVKEGIKVGQVYKNGLARRKVLDIKKHPLTQSKKVIIVQQWGDGNNREINIDPKEWGTWDLLIERVVLKVTEAQLKKIMESENLTKTAYPNGDMVKFDDCTKLNNNKVAQNGGCSQGDDGVVKLSKTKGSVVSKGN